MSLVCKSELYKQSNVTTQTTFSTTYVTPFNTIHIMPHQHIFAKVQGNSLQQTSSSMFGHQYCMMGNNMRH